MKSMKVLNIFLLITLIIFGTTACSKRNKPNIIPATQEEIMAQNFRQLLNEIWDKKDSKNNISKSILKNILKTEINKSENKDNEDKTEEHKIVDGVFIKIGDKTLYYSYEYLRNNQDKIAEVARYLYLAYTSEEIIATMTFNERALHYSELKNEITIDVFEIKEKTEESTENLINATIIFKNIELSLDEEPKFINIRSIDMKVVAKAENTKKDIVISIDGKDVSSTKEWVTKYVMNNFDNAIKEAKEHLNKPNVNQVEEEEINDKLNNAIDTFIKAKKNGIKEKNYLEIEITKAKDAKNGIEISIDGKNISSTQYWVTEEVMNTFNSAIIEIEELSKKEDISQEDLINARYRLINEIKIFNNNKKNGLRELNEAEKKLEQKLIEAEESKKDILISADGKDISEKNKWVTKEVMNDFEEAISNAKAVLDILNQKPEIVNQAITALNNQINIFNNAKKNGTKEATELANAKAELEAEIAKANTAKKDIKTSENGKDIPSTKNWVKQEVMNTFNSAIDVAQNVFNKANATQGQVNTAKADLTTAINTFNIAKKEGTKTLTYTVIKTTQDDLLPFYAYKLNLKNIDTVHEEAYSIKVLNSENELGKKEIINKKDVEMAFIISKLSTTINLVFYDKNNVELFRQNISLK